MKTPDKIEEEVDAIRRNLYEKTKNMTWDERLEFLSAKARAALPGQRFIVLPSRPLSRPLFAREDAAEYPSALCEKS